MPGRKQDDSDIRPAKAGWYPDPWSADGRGERYFDGKKWGTSERPTSRDATVTKIPTRRAARARLRQWAPVLIFVALVLAVWGIGRLRQSGNHATTVVTLPPVTTHLSAPPSTTRATSTTVSNARLAGPVCGRYCAYSLTGDWSKLQRGDCVHVLTDTVRKTFVFTQLSCTSPHDSEIYFAQRPDPAFALDPPPRTFADLISRVCGTEVLRSYAPRYASSHPNALGDVSTWGNGTKRVCAVPPDNPARPIART